MVGVVAGYGDAFGSAVACLIIVDTLFHIALDTGDAAAISRTAKIVHDKNLLLIKFPMIGTEVLWAKRALNIRRIGGGLCPFLPLAIRIFRWAAIRK